METEVTLLHRFANDGDADAFSQIVQRYAGLVYNASLRVLNDSSRAADATQETFFQLVRQSGEITGSLPAWLHKVATRKAINVIRKDSCLRRRETRYAVNRLRETDNWADISPYVDEGLNELDDEMREILIQRFFQGKTTTQIATEAGISQATVSRRIDAGVDKLRIKLHNRGIIVTTATLALLVGDNVAKAAPAAVIEESGKMALVSTVSSAASSAAGAATGAGVKAAGAATVMAGVKAKIITAAAATAVGVGSVVTYNQVTKPAQPAPTRTVTTPAKQATDRNNTMLSTPKQTTADQYLPTLSLAEKASKTNDLPTPSAFETPAADITTQNSPAVGGTTTRRTRSRARSGGLVSSARSGARESRRERPSAHTTSQTQQPDLQEPNTLEETP